MDNDTFIYGSVYNTYDMNTKDKLTVAGLKTKALNEVTHMYESRVKTLKADINRPHSYDSKEYRRSEINTLEMVIGDLDAILGGQKK